jgi:hypothetical protein
MPTLTELTAGYGNFMLSPRGGVGVCEVCFNLTDGYARCYACTHGELWLDAVAPISYSVAHEQLHHALACYKRLRGEPARHMQVELAAVLWRHLAQHERCAAAAAQVARFELVTTVPAGTAERDTGHSLRVLVRDLVGPVRGRYERLLERSSANISPREFDPRRFTARRQLGGEPVLLIDDTWTTGASAQSAAAALKSAGAGSVAAVVIGRHVNREWGNNNRRLCALTTPFDWHRCAYCQTGGTNRAPPVAPTNKQRTTAASD